MKELDFLPISEIKCPLAVVPDQVTLEDFFRAFGYQDDDMLYLRRFYDPDSKDPDHPGANMQAPLSNLHSLASSLKRQNEIFFGIYFVVNGGGKTIAQIKKSGCCRAQFMEIDDQSFEDQIAVIEQCELQPSIIVQTKKSLHAYWLLENGDINRFRGIQERLIHKYGSDPHVKDEARVMRLPGFYHSKNPDHRVMVKLLRFCPDLKYTQDQLEAVFPPAPKKQRSKTKKTTATAADVEKISSGERNGILYQKAAGLLGAGLTEKEVLATIRQINQGRCDEPLEDAELQSIVENASKYRQGFQSDAIEITDAPDIERELKISETDFSEWTWEQLSDQSFITELFSIQDGDILLAAQDRMINRAAELRKKGQMKELLQSYDKKRDKALAETKKTALEDLNTIVDIAYSDLPKGAYRLQITRWWRCSDNGVWLYDPQSEGYRQICCQPITIVSIQENIQAGLQLMEVAFKSNQRWKVITTERRRIANTRSIVDLADLGLAVNSLNARTLVKFFAELWERNSGRIPLKTSTSKLGWQQSGLFMPYSASDSLVFDSSAQQPVLNAIHAHGDVGVWKQMIRDLRQKNILEIKVALAVSCASVLLHHIGFSYGFWTDFWGPSGCGKTILLEIASSVWGDPRAGQFTGSFMQTKTALERSANLLNSLPMILDDSANCDNYVEKSMEQIIYLLTNGFEKTRAQKDATIRVTSSWKLAVISSGERQISFGGSSQAGAINRVLEVKCRDRIFEDPAAVHECMEDHYGFLGKWLIRFLTTSADGVSSKLKAIQRDFQRQLIDGGSSTDKQAMAGSLILTADHILTNYAFKDDCGLTIDDIRSILAERSEVDINLRCWHHVQGTIYSNLDKFHDPEASDEVDPTSRPRWGIIDNPDGGPATIKLVPKILKDVLRSDKDARYDLKGFVEWMYQNDILLVKKPQKKADGLRKYQEYTAGIAGTPQWMYLIVLEPSDWQNVGDTSDFLQVFTG